MSKGKRLETVGDRTFLRQKSNCFVAYGLIPTLHGFQMTAASFSFAETAAELAQRSGHHLGGPGGHWKRSDVSHDAHLPLLEGQMKDQG